MRQTETPPVLSGGQMAAVATVFYALMGATGLGLAAWQHPAGASAAVFGPPVTPRETLWHAGAGAGAGLGVALVSAWSRRFGPMRDLEGLLARALGDLSTPTIAVLAVASGIGEELLFRGGLQPWIGFWPTVLVFGFVHGGTVKALRLQVALATAAGALLGGLAAATGSLLAPILCHVVVNYVNMHPIAARARALRITDQGPAPRSLAGVSP